MGVLWIWSRSAAGPSLSGILFALALASHCAELPDKLFGAGMTWHSVSRSECYSSSVLLSRQVG